jgi:hypothetical protein
MLGIGRTFQVVKPLKRLSVADNVMAAAFSRESTFEGAIKVANEVLKFTHLEHVAQQKAGGLPIAGRMLNGNNFIGARTANGKYEVVDKVGGTFHTLYSAGVPAVGDTMLLVLTGNYWQLVINGTQLADGNTSLSLDEGYWGCSSHQVTDGDVLVSMITVLSNLMTEGSVHEWNGQDNIQFTAEGPKWKVASTATSYSLHTWNGATVQVVPVEEGETYIMRWFAQLGQYDVANFATFDVTNSQFINDNESYVARINDYEMTMVEVEVVAPVGCAEIAISPFRGTDGPAEIILSPEVFFFKKRV